MFFYAKDLKILVNVLTLIINNNFVAVEILYLKQNHCYKTIIYYQTNIRKR